MSTSSIPLTPSEDVSIYLTPSPTAKRKKATQKLSERKHPIQIYSPFIKQQCPDANECITLGKFVPLIRNYFENFDYQYLNHVKRIGKPSVNGLVHALTYEKEGYKAYCVLKSSVRKSADNLFFEWYIGHYFINKLVPKFPCFLETYGLNLYSDEDYYQLLQLSPELNKSDIEIFPNLIHLLDDSYFSLSNSGTKFYDLMLEACTKSPHISVVTQYLDPKHSMSFHDFIKEHIKTGVGFNLYILQILLQIYIPLGTLAHHFTHNDLHTNNILIYTLSKDEYITLTYDLAPNKTLQMRTKFIAKIIDYGRCFYKDFDNTNNSSSEFYDLLGEVKIDLHGKKDVQVCHKYKDYNGLTWFGDLTNKNYYISQLKGNVSKDLWTLDILYKNVGYYTENSDPTIKNSFAVHDGSSPFPSKANAKKLNEAFVDLLELMPLLPPTVSGFSMPPYKDKSDAPPFTKIYNVQSAMTELSNLWSDFKDTIRAYEQTYVVSSYTSIGEMFIFPGDLTKDSIFTAATATSGGAGTRARGGGKKTHHYHHRRQLRPNHKHKRSRRHHGHPI